MIFATLVAPALAIGLSEIGRPSFPQDLQRRLAAARRRAGAASPGSAQASAAAGELARIGREYLESGDAGRALEILEEAYVLDEENGLILAELTLAYVRTGDFPFARFYLELAERRAPRAPPEIYAILGDVYYDLNRVDDAVLAWEQFQRLGGRDARVLARLERANLERSLAARQSSFETSDFAFFFDAAISISTVRGAAKYLAQAYSEQAELFETRFPSRQIVLLYAGRSYFALGSVPDWASGVFDGKIRVVMDPDGGFTPELAGVLSHELAHALVRIASRDRAPAWLHEGLAQWCEGRRVLRGEFRRLFRGAAPVSLTGLEGSLARRAERAAARNGYLEALGLVEYLVQTAGPGAVVCLARDFGDGLGAEESLRRETGLSSRELVARWRAWAAL